MNNNNELSLSHVTERDIDKLLVEEWNCSLTFQRWFVQRILGETARGAKSLEVRARHSVSLTGEAGGETDIEATITIQKKKVLLFIEDKIHSPFSERQGERYQQRAQCAKDEKRCAAQVLKVWWGITCQQVSPGRLMHGRRNYCGGDCLPKARSIFLSVRSVGVCLPDSMRESVSWRIPARFANSC